jgi:hypothetical protein
LCVVKNLQKEKDIIEEKNSDLKRRFAESYAKRYIETDELERQLMQNLNEIARLRGENEALKKSYIF